jgi:hypothetical protein
MVRVTPAGLATPFPLPVPESAGQSITVGPDGALWFLNDRGIGRMTTDGGFKQYRVPWSQLTRLDIVAGPDGAIWFTTVGGVGRMTTEGKTTRFETIPNVAEGGLTLEEYQESPSSIVAGGDGRLWFLFGPGKIGRITPKGRLSAIRVRGERQQAGLAAGAGEAVWYSTYGQRRCEGGSSCWTWPFWPGFVGRIDPGPLEAEVRSVRTAGGLRRIKARVLCEGGRAGRRCRGTLRLKRRGVLLAEFGLRLATDGERVLTTELDRRARRILDRPQDLNVTVILRLAGAATTRSSVKLPGT